MLNKISSIVGTWRAWHGGADHLVALQSFYVCEKTSSPRPQTAQSKV